MLRLPDVLKLIGVSRSTLYLWIRQNQFPSPIQLGANSVGWRASAINKWIDSRPPSLRIPGNSVSIGWRIPIV
ncbi:MAG: AlpA family phage regulatory protein, partial [Magnetococcales bacterium]|nr:AlpA family phage regulatory protein [Magnetococcales bacterium]